MFATHLDQSYPAEVRESIASVTIAKLGANSAVRFAPPFIATIATDLDLSLTTLGAAIAVGEFAGLSGPLITRLAGRFSRRSSICVGLLAIAAGAVICATSTTAVQFAVGLATMTMSKILFDVGVIGWISDRVPYTRMGRVVGLTETAWAGSLLLGVVAMGLLTDATSWRWGYGLVVVALILFSTMIRGRLPNEVPPARVTRQQRRERPRLGAGWLVIVATVAIMASAQSVFVTFGKWLQNDFDFSDSQLAILVFAMGGVELLAATSTVRFADRWGKQLSTMAGVLVMIPAGLLLAAVNSNLVLGLAMLAAFVCGFEFAIVSSLSLASNLVPAHPSTGVGLMIGAGTLGRAITATPAAAAYTSKGMWLVAVIAAGCAALSFGCQWVYRVRRPTGT